MAFHTNAADAAGLPRPTHRRTTFLTRRRADAAAQRSSPRRIQPRHEALALGLGCNGLPRMLRRHPEWR